MHSNQIRKTVNLVRPLVEFHERVRRGLPSNRPWDGYYAAPDGLEYRIARVVAGDDVNALVAIFGDDLDAHPDWFEALSCTAANLRLAWDNDYQEFMAN